MLPEPIRVTLAVAGTLERLGVRYVVGGSLASAVHGVVRATMDADILAELRLADAVRLEQSLSGDFYPRCASLRPKTPCWPSSHGIARGQRCRRGSGAISSA